MSKASILLTLCCIVGFFLQSYAQTTITLKNGETFNVVINYTAEDKISYTILGDSTKKQHQIRKDKLMKINGEIIGYGDFPINEKTGRAEYTDVVNVEGNTAEQLYLRAKEWFAVAFKDSRTVLEFDDNITHKLIGNGSFPVIIKELGLTRSGGNVKFTITLQFKDGRYKYKISNLIYHYPKYYANNYPLDVEKNPSISIHKKNWIFIQDQAKERIQQLIKSLQNFILTSEESDNW